MGYAASVGIPVGGLVRKIPYEYTWAAQIAAGKGEQIKEDEIKKTDEHD